MRWLLIPIWAELLLTSAAVPALAQPAADRTRATEAKADQSTGDQAKADHAKQLAIEALADLIRKKGLEGGCAEMRTPDGYFYQGETYAFIMDLKGVWRCFPPKPAAEGLSALEVQDPDGKLLVKQMLLLSRKGYGYVELGPRCGAGAASTRGVGLLLPTPKRTLDRPNPKPHATERRRA